MAGDWIKIEHTLPDKPEVERMAELLDLDPDAIVGKLVRVWAWVDQHSLDGNALSVTEKALDRRTQCEGFAGALRKVGWLDGRDGALSFPRFDRHNGQTAKARAACNRRVAEHRARNSNCGVTLPPLQKPLPEKRREEDSVCVAREGEIDDTSALGASKPGPIPATNAEAVFERFWAAYPNQVKKPRALAAFQRNRCVEKSDEVMEGLRRWLASDQWARKVYQLPETWLDERQWEDHPVSAADVAAARSQRGGNGNHASPPVQPPRKLPSAKDHGYV